MYVRVEIMRNEDRLKEKYGTEDPFRVPEKYFDEFRVNLMENLPEYPAKPVVPQMTAWQKLKPYIYMAAMFCGIWLMMRIFHDISSRDVASLDNMPESVVLALSDNYADEYFAESEDESTIELEEYASMSYNNIDEFERDFGYQFKPEYD